MASLTALQPHARLLSLMGTVLGVAIGSTAAASYSYYTLRMTAEAQQNAAELLKAELVKEKEVRETSLSHMNELLKAELVKEKELRMAELVKGNGGPGDPSHSWPTLPDAPGGAPLRWHCRSGGGPQRGSIPPSGGPRPQQIRESHHPPTLLLMTSKHRLIRISSPKASARRSGGGPCGRPACGVGASPRRRVRCGGGPDLGSRGQSGVGPQWYSHVPLPKSRTLVLRSPPPPNANHRR